MFIRSLTTKKTALAVNIDWTARQKQFHEACPKQMEGVFEHRTNAIDEISSAPALLDHITPRQKHERVGLDSAKDVDQSAWNGRILPCSQLGWQAINALPRYMKININLL
mmetsp:Transcript_16147/g.46580  ORF Transcript_16147/g.46580 Transcript_16147/m.46580 type:complete len:110 (-) Transcript_16147:293-622(-)